MTYVVYSDTNSDTDNKAGSTRLNFIEADLVTAMKASVKVNGVKVKGCSTNPFPTWARAQLWGYFFNTGVPTPGSALNDVLANILILNVAQTLLRLQTSYV